jgi:cardiolipin synthase (CMP-forming)
LTIHLLWLPNFISLLRLAAAPLVAWLLYSGRFGAALLVLLAAGLTDWLDGYAARKLGAKDRLGIILDPLADKVLIVVVFVAMGLLNLVPFWLFVLAATRDIVIVSGAYLLRLLRNRREFLPSLLGKVSTFFQIILALLALLNAAFPDPVLAWLKMIGVFTTALFTGLSGLDYVRQGIEMARLPPLGVSQAEKS